MNINRVFFILLLSLFSCKCRNLSPFERQIINEIEVKCDENLCKIDISKVTKFKWQKFFIFKETATIDTIESKLKQKYPYFNDVAKRIVFLSADGKIIYHEDIS